jgi:hypothetical protein
MEATDFKANPEEMECESGHREVPKEDDVVKLVKGREKRHRGIEATRRTKGNDPRRWWIPEEVGCRLQKGAPSCRSGTEQEKRLQ